MHIHACITHVQTALESVGLLIIGDADGACMRNAYMHIHTYIHTCTIHMQTALESVGLLIVGDADGNQSLHT